MKEQSTEARLETHDNEIDNLYDKIEDLEAIILALVNQHPVAVEVDSREWH